MQLKMLPRLNMIERYPVSISYNSQENADLIAIASENVQLLKREVERGISFYYPLHTQ